MSQLSAPTEKEITEGKVFALLGYLSILCIIPLVFKRENSFVLHHAKQGLVLFVGEVAVLIIQIILGELVFRLGMFVLGVFSFCGLVYVLQGKQIRLPFIAEWADQLTI